MRFPSLFFICLNLLLEKSAQNKRETFPHSLWALEVRTMPAPGGQVSRRAGGETALRWRSRGRSRLPEALSDAGPGGSGLPAAAAGERRESRLQRPCSSTAWRPGSRPPEPHEAGAVPDRGQERAGPWRLPPRSIPDLGRIGAGRGQAGGDAPGLGTWDQPPAGPGALTVRAGCSGR